MPVDRDIDTSDLTESSVKLAGRVQEKLDAGVKTFKSLRTVVAALAPVVLAAFAVGVYSMTLARKSDQAATDAHVQALEAKQAVQQADLTHNHDDVLELRQEMRDRFKGLDDRFGRVEDILRGVAGTVGAPPEGVKQRGGRR